LKNTIEVLAFVPKNSNTDNLFTNISILTYIDSIEKLQSKLKYKDDYVHPRILVVDVAYILDRQHPLHVDIKKDLMYKNASIVVYGKDIPLKEKYKFYDLDIKGIIDENNSNKDEIFAHIKRRSNLYSSSYKNNTVRAAIDYFEVGEKSKKLTYTLDYLIYKYNLSDKDAGNIRVVLIYLLVSFMQNKFIQTAKLLNTVYKSHSINELYKSYMNPKSFHEKILSVLLSLNIEKEIAGYIANINLKSVEPELIEEIRNLYHTKNTIIASHQDIIFFWEQLYLLILEEHTDLDITIFDTLLNTTSHILVNFLTHSNYFLCSIPLFDAEKITIDFQFPNTKNNLLKEYTTYITNSVVGINFVIDEMSDDTKVSMSYDINIITDEKIDNKSIIDTSSIESMHYEESKKVSAIDFLQEYAVDYEILEDLHDNAVEIKDLLYKEEILSRETLDSIVAILRKYITILYETIEFSDIAFSLEGLVTLFSNINIDEIENSKKEMLSTYIQGLVDDLSNWKHHIFINADTPDIHYLDASLLENASSIETFLLGTAEDESIDDDDDLEFF